MFKSALFLLSAVSLFSQTLPAPPACLSGPVTQGSVTLSCSAIDNTPYGGTADSGNHAYLFQVRVTSADPDVTGLRVVLSWQVFIANQPPIVSTRAVQLTKTESAFLYTFEVPTGLDTKAKPVPFWISAVHIEEMKPSSSATF